MHELRIDIKIVFVGIQDVLPSIFQQVHEELISESPLVVSFLVVNINDVFALFELFSDEYFNGVDTVLGLLEDVVALLQLTVEVGKENKELSDIIVSVF